MEREPEERGDVTESGRAVQRAGEPVMGPWGPSGAGPGEKPSIGGPDGPRRRVSKARCVVEEVVCRPPRAEGGEGGGGGG